VNHHPLGALASLLVAGLLVSVLIGGHPHRARLLRLARPQPPPLAMAALPAIPAEVGEFNDAEEAMVRRATASKAIPWRVARRTASGELVREAAIAAGTANPGMVHDVTLTRTPAGLVTSTGLLRAA